jgi:hypothetical protein
MLENGPVFKGHHRRTVVWHAMKDRGLQLPVVHRVAAVKRALGLQISGPHQTFALIVVQVRGRQLLVAHPQADAHYAKPDLGPQLLEPRQMGSA